MDKENNSIIQFPPHAVAGMPREKFNEIKGRLEQGDSMGLSPEQVQVLMMRFGISLDRDVPLEFVDPADEAVKKKIAKIEEAIRKGISSIKENPED